MIKYYTFVIIIIFTVLIFFSCKTKNIKNTKTVEQEKFYDDGEFVPIWAKTAIWYQIFPDRFFDGDTTNNPQKKDIVGADPQEPPLYWKIHPWTSDWYRLQEYEFYNRETEYWKNLLRRRYGGDLQGIINKLDYLSELGITAIYLNPVFTAPSLHKYDGACYHHIDPNFGPDPEGDRELIKNENPLDTATWVWTKADELALELIEKAHKLGIRIIFDGVFNHLGINSFAFQDVLKNQEKSPYKDWFIIKQWRDSAKGIEFEYEGWWGVKSLPELREDENGIVKGPKDYIFASTKRWMNPKNKGTDYGIDGWRLDVAFCVDHKFWKDWRKHVRSINPQAYLTAEIVDKPEKVVPYLQGDEFDGEMSYNFLFAVTEFFINPTPINIKATEFDKKLKELRDLYPKGVAYVSMNLLGSHDVNRIGSYIVNRGIGLFRDWGNYFGISKAIDNPMYNTRKPTEEEYHLQKLLVIFQMTYLGAPMIYYGDEVGMWGSNDPDCRKPMVWKEFIYEDEQFLPTQIRKMPDKVEVNTDLLEHYKKTIKIRKENPALIFGSYKTLIANDSTNIFAFEREYKNNIVIVAFNNSLEEKIVRIPITNNGDYFDKLNGSEYFTLNNEIKVTIPKKWAVILSMFKEE
jgi:glycosidase